MPEEGGSAYLSIRWQTVAILSLVVTGAALASLVVVANRSDSQALATIALALAVVTFISQLLVFVAQVLVSNRQIEQSERVSSQTSRLLSDVSSRIERIDTTQLQQFREIRETLMPAALGERWAGNLDAAVEDVARLDPQIAALLEQRLSGIRGEILEAATEREVLKERVECPYCGTTNIAEVGNLPGDSAICFCHSCSRRFHVNRRGDGGVKGNKPGSANDPETLLTKGQMILPDYEERCRVLSTLFDEWSIGAFENGHAITAWMDAPRAVKTPLFFALVNLDYGTISLGDGDGDRIGDSAVEPPREGIDRDEWLRDAHSGWIAQALYRLATWRRTSTDEAEFFFGRAVLTDEQESILKKAKLWDRNVRHRDGSAESSGAEDTPGPTEPRDEEGAPDDEEMPPGDEEEAGRHGPREEP